MGKRPEANLGVELGRTLALERSGLCLWIKTV